MWAEVACFISDTPLKRHVCAWDSGVCLDLNQDVLVCFQTADLVIKNLLI